MADPLSLQVMEDITTRLAAVTGITGATYDEPFDYEQASQPWGWIYDFGETFDPNIFAPKIKPSAHVVTLVSFIYAASGTNSIRRIAHRWRATLMGAFCGVKVLSTTTYCLEPVRDAIQDLAAQRERLGAVQIEWELDYGIFTPGS